MPTKTLLLSVFRFTCLLFAALLVGTGLNAQCPPDNKTVLYVDAAKPISGDGFAWGTAFKTVQEALEASGGCGTINQIWIKKGTYYPSSYADCGDCYADEPRFNTFKLRNGVSLYGGFSGAESDIAQRNTGTNATILSGNIGASYNTDNCFHVLLAYNISLPTVIDGITVQDGNADVNSYNNNAYNSNGGGVNSNNSTLTFNQCNFLQNESRGGGAVLNGYTSNLTFTNCIFNQNFSVGGGGAIYTFLNSMLQTTNCLYSYNHDNTQGGALATGIGATLNISNSTFFKNELQSNADGGGAIYLDNTSTANVSNTIFSRNSLASGGSPNYSLPYSDIQAVGALNITNSETQTNLNCGTCVADINTDPLFANSGDMDGADNIWRTADDGLRLTTCSPGYNSGSNALVPAGATTDIKGASRIQVNSVDMGAYEIAAYSFTNNIVYVDSAATGLNDGSSWANAFTTLGAAIEVAKCSQDIWVKKGTYYPTTNPPGCYKCDVTQRNYSFRITTNVAIYGGFSGTETTIDDRNISANPTILSGDIGVQGDSTDNCFHVVVAAGKFDTKWLDGFIIKDGLANGNETGLNGYFIEDTKVADYAGGGIGVVNSIVRLKNITLEHNTANLYGGAISVSDQSTLLLEKTDFVDNYGAWYAGAIYSTRSTIIANTSVFYGNHAQADGAIYASSTNLFANNCLFTNNYADAGAGAVEASDNSSVDLSSCNFVGNHITGTANDGAGAIYCFNGSLNNIQLHNSIFYNNYINNQSADFTGGNSDIAASALAHLTNCSVQTQLANCTNCPAGYNINPKFANKANPAGADGQYGTADDGLKLLAGSPLINQGDNVGANGIYTDMVGNARIQDGIVDIGAYEHAPVCLGVATLYVDSSRSSSGNGFSWAEAFSTLQEALDITINCPDVTQVWVKKGTYYPTEYPAGCSDCGTDPRNKAFFLRPGLAIYGGFNGTETDVAERNIENNPTVLSGNIGNPALATDNCYHVVITGINTTAMYFDGFTVSDGYADGYQQINLYGQTYDQFAGAAMANRGNQELYINQCLFTNNYGSLGGAMLNASSGIGITKSKFTNNSNLSGTGGAITNNSQGNITVSNSVFSDNTASVAGAFSCNGVTAYLINCLFNNNMAQNAGGAIYTWASSIFVGSNCTFYGNYVTNNDAGSAGALFIGFDNGQANITNSLFSKNSINGNGAGAIFSDANADINNQSTTLTLSYSAMQSGIACYNCITPNATPFFINETNPPGADGKFGTADDGLALSIASPAINKGDNNAPLYPTDLAGAARIQNTTIDLGAYETASCYANSVVFVDNTKSASGDGYSWDGAFKSLDEALGAAQNCASIQQVWVRKGTYYPSSVPYDCSNCSASPRNYTFYVRNGLLVYGGFNGTEGDIADRDITANPTILSGDIGTAGDNTDNVLHVLAIEENSLSNVIDGFTVRDGNANLDNTSITISGNTLPGDRGGGLVEYNNHNLMLLNCHFTKNNALYGGGGVYNYGTYAAAISHCFFTENRSENYGGAMHNQASKGVVVSNSVFNNNSCGIGGGGVCSENSSYILLTNCLFNSNSASNSGGAVYSNFQSQLEALNTTFYGNYIVYNGPFGGAINTSISTITNCIFSMNSYNGVGNGAITTGTGSDIYQVSTFLMQYSLPQSNLPCTSCLPINTDPRFANENSPTGADGKFATADDGLKLKLGSPAINAGTNSPINTNLTELAGGQRIQDAQVDMGAYENSVCPTFNRLYVNGAIGISGDGSTWPNSYKTLQEAIDAAANCTNIKEIWVAKGSYKPSAYPAGCTDCTSSGDTRKYSFLLRNGIKWYGGFAGTEGNISERNIAANNTILTGDISDPDADTDNAYHIVLSLKNVDSSLIDGFTFLGGFATGGNNTTFGTEDFNNRYGAAFSSNSSKNLSIANCLFYSNHADYSGGAIRNYKSDLSLSKCKFDINNSGSTGGAVYNYINATLKADKCIFYQNTSSQAGAIDLEYFAPAILTQCLLTYNAGSTKAGAIMVQDGSKLTAINSTFFGNNSAGGNGGGAVYLKLFGQPDSANIYNCIFKNNSNQNNSLYYTPGADIYNEGAALALQLRYSALQVANANSSSFLNQVNQPVVFQNEISPLGDDGVFGTADDGFKPAIGSPTINAADNTALTADMTTDFAGETRIAAGRVDMGAYEFNTCPTQTTLYVDSSVAVSGNGFSWATAFKTLQEAIDVNASCTLVKEVWVKKGTYLPTAYPNGCTDCVSDGDLRKQSFLMQNDISFYGGFNGTEQSINERNIVANPTILSGDIGFEAYAADNSYHVVMAFHNTGTTTLDGFIIKDGNANSTMVNYATNIQYTPFVNNQGGGLMAEYYSNFTVANCTFQNNNAELFGGGMELTASLGGIANVTKCLFANNSTNPNNGFSSGGAIRAEGYATLNVDNTVFTANNGYKAGAVDINDFEKGYFNNCVFNQNSAQSAAGAIRVSLGSKIFANNNTFFGNFITMPDEGAGAILVEGNVLNPDTAYIRNSIFYKNVNDHLTGDHFDTPNSDIRRGQQSVVVIQQSALQNGVENCCFNPNTNPLFVSEYNTAGADGRYGTPDDGLALQSCSPFINKGNNTYVEAGNTIDVAGLNRIQGDAVELGAYEYPGSNNGNPNGGDYLAINGDNSTINAQVNQTSTFIAFQSACRIIATLRSGGDDPVLNTVNAKAYIDKTVQSVGGRFYVQRHYEITPNNNEATATGRVTLYFSQQEFDNFNDAVGQGQLLPTNSADDMGKANVRVYQYHGGSVDGQPGSYTGTSTKINPVDTDIIWDAALQRWEVTFDVVGFSGFFAGVESLDILPVQLISFTGQLNSDKKSTHLQWQVAQQESINKYVVEKSADGATYTAIGTVAANNLTSTSYSFTDNQLTINTQFYYRLKMASEDGSNSYSQIITLAIHDGYLPVLYPLPAKDFVWIKDGGTELLGTTAIVTDMQGKTLQQVRIAQWPQRISTIGLASGMYFIKLANNQTLKMIVGR